MNIKKNSIICSFQFFWFSLAKLAPRLKKSKRLINVTGISILPIKNKFVGFTENKDSSYFCTSHINMELNHNSPVFNVSLFPHPIFHVHTRLHIYSCLNLCANFFNWETNGKNNIFILTALLPSQALNAPRTFSMSIPSYYTAMLYLEKWDIKARQWNSKQ